MSSLCLYTSKISLWKHTCLKYDPLSPLGIVHKGSLLLCTEDPIFCRSPGYCTNGIPFVVQVRSPFVCIRSPARVIPSVDWKGPFFVNPRVIEQTGSPLLYKWDPLLCVSDLLQGWYHLLSPFLCGSRRYCTNGIPFVVQVKSPFVCIGSRSRVIWGGYT